MSGLKNFVQRSDTANSRKAVSERRSQAAAVARIQTKPTFGAAQSQPATNNRHAPNTASQMNPPFTQRAAEYPSVGKGLLDDSVLGDESDFTMTTIAGGDEQHYESPPHDHNEWDPENDLFSDEEGDDPDHDNERYEGDNRIYGYSTNGEGIQIARFPKLPYGIPPGASMTAEEVQQRVHQYQVSTQHAQATKAVNGSVAVENMALHHGRSGRFIAAPSQTASENMAPHIRRSPVRELYGTKEGRSQLAERNNNGPPDDPGSSDLESPHTPPHPHKVRRSRIAQAKDTGHKQEHVENPRNLQEEDRFAASELEEASEQPSPVLDTPRALEQIKKRASSMTKRPSSKRALELDYEQTALFRMNYSELKDQLFDTNPRSVTQQDSAGHDTSLEDRLKYFADRSDNEKGEFFARLPMDQWEESGDWFLGQFGDILSRFKEARKAKRDISKTFEEELATREEAVRTKAEGLKDVMKQMRAGGEGVLRGRTP
jgi:hypothetical protein